MRQVQPLQLQLGEIDIASIQFDPRSRDDIPQLLRGLQYLYTERKTQKLLFQLLETITPEDVDADNGRPGLSLWKILVMGTLRLNLNWDYDRLLEMVNNHKTIREMLGHGLHDENEPYKLQTLKDNVRLLTPELLDPINQLVVDAGHRVLKRKETEIKARCDSFVAKTHVHFPTDISILWDAIRKVVTLTARLSEEHELTLWRQSQFNLRQVKKDYRKVQKTKHSTSKDEQKKTAQQQVVIQACEAYLQRSVTLINKAQYTLTLKAFNNPVEVLQVLEIEEFIAHAYRQIEQITRRVIQDEKIPHHEKVFSIFQPHTEWISKGKAGVPVELGLKTCVLEDQYGFILHHRVMQKETDDKIAVRMVTEAQSRFSGLTVCSFDKGFHSPENQKELKNHLRLVVLPKKGRLNEQEKAHEYAGEFKSAKRQHSAVESAINALEVHGLDVCPDHGIEGFKRYISLAIVSRNIQKLGAELRKIENPPDKKNKRAA